MNHQVRMDVIGNNIANVNTIGYRGRRTTFEESFNQLVKGASRTESKAGGTNPMQVGLGVAVGSIDIMTGQGQLQNTGRLFDLAIEGNAFFGVSDGTGTYYTRNGAFQLDNDGYIILPTNGMVLQGKMADLYGNFPPGTAIGNLQIPMTQQAPAKETTEIKLGKNLNSDSGAKGSISYTQQFLVAADGARQGTKVNVDWPAGLASGLPAARGDEDTGRDETPLTSLYDSHGNSLGIMAGDFLTISWYSSSDTTNKDPSNLHTLRIKVVDQESKMNPWDTFEATNGNPPTGQVRNLEQLRQAIQYAVNVGNETGAPIEVKLEDNGSLSIKYPNTAGFADPSVLNNNIFSLQIKSNNPIEQSASYVSKAFSFDSYIGDGSGKSDKLSNFEAKSDAFLRPAERYDYIVDLKNNKGNSVNTGLEPGDTIDVFGSVGKDSIEGTNKQPPLQYWTQESINDAFIKALMTLPAGDPIIGVYSQARQDSYDAAYQAAYNNNLNYYQGIYLAAYNGANAAYEAAYETNRATWGDPDNPVGTEEQDAIDAGIAARTNAAVIALDTALHTAAAAKEADHRAAGIKAIADLDKTDDGTRMEQVWALTDKVPRVATMLDELMKKIVADFSLAADSTERDKSIKPTVYMDYAGTDDGIPPGSMVILGAPGEMFQINSLQIRAENVDLDENTPSIFNGITKISQKRAAVDAAHIPVEIPVYDSAGTEHTLTIVFVQTDVAGEWKWEARFSGREEINPKTSGTGRLFFGPDGAVSSWTFENGGSELIVDPKNGADFMRIRLDVGGPGDFQGIVQWDGATTVNTIGQDGYGTGVLTELTIDEYGLLEGSFSNGTHRPIAQLLLVDFANPGGLLDVSDSVYTISANSGDPIWGTPKRQSSSNLKPGALEMSNVDLSAEFTTMITTQRGYQANSRIITVSDTMLEELVNLKR
jgi:flagellar hook-basal body protein